MPLSNDDAYESMKAAIDTTVDLEVDLHVHRMHKIAFLHDDEPLIISLEISKIRSSKHQQSEV